MPYACTTVFWYSLTEWPIILSYLDDDFPSSSSRHHIFDVMCILYGDLHFTDGLTVVGALLSLRAGRKWHGTCLLVFVVMKGLFLSIYRRAHAICMHDY